MASDAIRAAVVVPLAPEQAFRLFAPGLASWWPREYTWGQEALETIAIEPHEGGFCYERGPHGFRSDWGRVLAWEPPKRLRFTWQIGPGREPLPDPARASEVQVTFVGEEADATRVELEHREFERHGEGGGGYRAALGSEQGWPYILDRYAAAASARRDGDD
jgi:uncharacterized protein YndB with AHSA1/START domain